MGLIFDEILILSRIEKPARLRLPEQWLNYVAGDNGEKRPLVVVPATQIQNLMMHKRADHAL